MSMIFMVMLVHALYLRRLHQADVDMAGTAEDLPGSLVVPDNL